MLTSPQWIAESHAGRAPRPAPSASSLAFGPYTLDRRDASLWKDGSRIALTPKAYALLALLVENAGHLVTKDDILAAVWSDTFVTDAVVKVCVSELRRALGDSVRAPVFIETQARLGYRFIAPLRENDETETSRESAGMLRIEPLGDDPAELMNGLLDAAESAARNGQHRDCMDHLGHALTSAQFLFPEDRALACELMIRLGQAAQYAGRALQARSALQRALAFARELDRPELLARAALALGEGHASPLVVDAELVRNLEASLQPIQDTRSPLVARLQARLACALYRVEGSEARRRKLVDSALDRSRDSRSPAEIAWILRYTLWATWGPGDVEARLASSHRLVPQVSRETTISSRPGSPRNTTL